MSLRPLLCASLGLLAACSGDTGVKVYNSAPTATITSPPDGTGYIEGDAVAFQGRVNDLEEPADGLLTSWYSDLDGVLAADANPDGDGLVELNIGNLSPGNHIITLSVVDSEASSGTDTVEVSVQGLDADPDIAVAHPIAGEYGIEGNAFEYSALVADEQDDPADLAVMFASDLDGVFCEPTPDIIGQARCSEVLSVGEHTLTYTVTDLDGLTGEVQVFFEVIGADQVDNDGDGYSEAEGDCNDANPAVNPVAPEIGCNEVDDNCNGVIDENSPCYDDDGDGYTELYDDDCDDADAGTYPGAPETCDGADNDCDGLVDEGTSCVDDDYDGFTELDGDCDDGDASVYPGAPEEPDGVDDDCDGLIDEGTTAYDDDGDCFCELAPCTGGIDPSCTLEGGDCNDGDIDINPFAIEECDLVDNDCNDGVDEPDAVDAVVWYQDVDGDGYGTGTSTLACWEPAGYSAYTGDCDDSSGSVYPGAPEACDGVDNDCDAAIDEGVTAVYYRDADGDGYGNPAVSISDCSVTSGYVVNSDDCDDGNAAINPTTVWYIDADGDGYGSAATTKTQCTQPTSYVLNATDCNDGTASAHPGGLEACSDGIDNDCDGSVDEVGAVGCTNYYIDNDGDSYGGASSQCQCAATAPYTANNNSDCYDYDAAVKPGATGWFSYAHGGGGYDYNCDGVETKKDTAIGGCHLEISWSSVCDEDPAGWSGSSPACGSSGSWIWDCHIVAFDCATDTYALTQQCH